MHSQLSAAKLLALFTALTLLCTAPLAAQTLGANFTYQGQLQQGGIPLNTTADFEFKLFDALTAGLQIGSTQPVSGVNIVDGLFTVSLDFGSTSFNGNNRWLEIHVRSPAGAGAFTLLTPRQPLAATPYALYALTGPGSGGPWVVSGNNIFNTNTGNVGIGTTNPASKLHVNGGLRLGGSTTNFARADQDGSGLFLEHKGNSTATSKIRLQTSKSGDLTNYSQFFIDPTFGFSFMDLGSGNSNVGIGTDAPAAKLDVRGNIRLGDSGELFAPAGQENLRIIRGIIAENGSILEGTGFSVSHPDAGRYIVTFTTPFADVPTITANADRHPTAINGVWCVMTDNVTAFSSELLTGNVFASPPWQDRTFQFIAIGPR